MHRTLLRDFQAASGVKRKINHMIDSEHKKILKRRQMLVNEMNEAALFVDKAETVYRDTRVVLQSIDCSMQYTSISKNRLQNTYGSPLFRRTMKLHAMQSLAKASKKQQQKNAKTPKKRRREELFCFWQLVLRPRHFDLSVLVKSHRS